MAQALLIPLIERGDFLPEQILGVVAHRESIQRSLDKLPKGVTVVTADDSISDEVWTAPIQLLAVKPQQLSSINKKKSDIKKSILISLLAGVSLKRLKDIFPSNYCVRAVVNAPILVQSGLTALSWEEELNISDQIQVKAIFNDISEVFELKEKELDAFLALTSSGPAYVALMVEALADGAVAAGLSRSMANYLSHQMIFGSALLIKERNIHPAQLKDMVTSPAGTTIKALRHLEMAGLRSALIEAVVVAAERSRELA